MLLAELEITIGVGCGNSGSLVLLLNPRSLDSVGNCVCSGVCGTRAVDERTRPFCRAHSSGVWSFGQQKGSNRQKVEEGQASDSSKTFN
jgi:hypothetical protein